MQVYKEKVFDTPDRMDLVHTLCILHALRNLCRKYRIDDAAAALDVIFCWVDDTSLLIGELTKGKGESHDQIQETF